jgi:uncharacterized protein (TIGR03435 family)
MLRTFSRGMIGILAAAALFAQLQPARPAYEAAVVKVNTSGSNSTSANGTKSQIVFTNYSLRRLVEWAYNVKPFQVTGPGWLENVRFDIAAKYPPDTKSEDRPPMLRTLLEDRFKLVVHRESKDMPGYALMVAKSGFKLRPAEPGGNSTSTTNHGHLQIWTIKGSMALLVDLLARDLGVSVVDKTALDGVYDIALRWNDDQTPNGADADAAPSLFTALQETLGLHLQPQKVAVEIIVVDSAERSPTEN